MRLKPVSVRSEVFPCVRSGLPSAFTSRALLGAAPSAVLCCLLVLPPITGISAQESFSVERVVDGDTVVLRDLGTVRLIGVDTPETQDPREPVQHFGIEAAGFLRKLLTGQSVRVDYDQQRLDRYRRTLAYLFLNDGTFVNREIVRQGYGHAYLIYPFRHLEDFRAAEAEARANARGLWGDAPEQAAAREPSRVWVNTSSRVYHCPGTRYYGNTARGEFLDEPTARQRGFRPAYGRECGPVAGTPSNAPNTALTAAVAPVAALGPPAEPTADSAAGRVWVNTSSRVYHCEGSRYFGTTARGEYMTESEATGRGHRPAGGRLCGVAARSVSSADAGKGVAAPAAALAAVPTSVSSDIRVWVNTSSKVYHCPGARYYGATKNGAYLSQRDAQAQGFRPAGGRACS